MSDNDLKDSMDQSRQEGKSKDQKNVFKETIFYEWILDNHFIVSTMILIIVLVLIFLITKVAYLLNPIWLFIQAIFVPILVGLILYYLLLPIVNFLNRRGLSRTLSIILGFILIILVLVFLILAVIPGIQNEITGLVKEWPTIWANIRSGIERLPNQQLDNAITNVTDNLGQWITKYFENVLNTTLSGLSSVFGVAFTVVMAIVTAPILAYYMLAEGHKFVPTVAELLPTKIRHHIVNILELSHYQLSHYITGQVMVAATVGVIFFIGYLIIGLPYAGLLAILAGMMNVIPWLGSWIAMIPAYLVAITQGPWMVLYVTIVLLIEQLIESRLVSPLIIGNRLEIHPIIIMLLILAGGQMFGIGGVIIVVPAYAVVKVIFSYLFNLFKENSSLYN